MPVVGLGCGFVWFGLVNVGFCRSLRLCFCFCFVLFCFFFFLCGVGGCEFVSVVAVGVVAVVVVGGHCCGNGGGVVVVVVVVGGV